MFGLPLLQLFVPAPAPSSAGVETLPIALVIVALLAVLVGLGLLGATLGRPSRRSRRPRHRPRGKRQAVAGPQAGDSRQIVLIDGSNVIHWLDNTPQLAPLRQVVHDLARRGYKPGVVFDANIGYKLTGKFMGERDLSRMLSLPKDQILVVPKGQQADPFLLETARDLKAPIVTNDRYRDWVERYPDVARPEMLVTGEMRDGRVWLAGLEAKGDATSGAL
jgi:hypothetical protein